MTPPEASVAGDPARAAETPPAVSPFLTLKTRADFLRAARGAKAATPGFILQGRPRSATDPAPADAIRVGFTCSRKVGNAVARNRAKRRLRALAREVLPGAGRSGWDYVLIGRAGETAARPYPALVEDLRRALPRIHGARA